MLRSKDSVRIFLMKKTWWTAGLCALLAAIVFGVVNYPAAVNTAASPRQLPIYCVQRDQKMLSISFDAAWGNEDTPQLIDILSRYNVKATFFVVGDWVDRYPESVKALHDAGHEIMNHSNTHAHLPQLSAQEITKDLNACNDKIEAITGVRPTLIRPPYGDYDDNSIRAIRSMGMEPIQWDVDVPATNENHLGPTGLRVLFVDQRMTTLCRSSSFTVFFEFKRNEVSVQTTTMSFFSQRSAHLFSPMHIDSCEGE